MTRPASERCTGIVVGVDGSARSAATLRRATRYAERNNLPLTLLLPRPPLRWRTRRIVDHALRVVDASCRAGGPSKVITRLV